MSNLSININTSPQSVLASIKNAIDKNDDIIPFDADFYFTKGKPGKTSGYIFREKVLENDVVNWLKSRVSFDVVMSRYKNYDPNLISLEWPRHYATRFVNVRGKAAEGENIFMFFPEVLGIDAGTIDDYFGFEFVDIWASVFDEIVFPCVRKVFDEETQLKLFTTLRPVLDKTIYLASIFHEVGHRCGYWKVSPEKDSRIHINKFNTDVLGELSTDTLLVNLLPEFPEVLSFIFLQRLFWFGRFGFKNNPMSGKLNEDNDTWIGSYLFNQYIENEVLTKTLNGRWNVNFDLLKALFSHVIKDIDQLGCEVISKTNQNSIIQNWMRKNVSYRNNQFILSKEIQTMFLRCADISEKPLRKY